jgi:2',3'-cyclic-nucleotide 2'-phosphodiesterase (5'-nucleotidase family)
MQFLAALAALAAPLAAPRSDSILLRVLTLNDFHGALQPREYPWSNGRLIGGIAALKSTMDSLGAECSCPVLRLDAGDQMQGTLASNLVYGRSAVEAMNLLGLSAAAVGNHELDWGVDTLKVRQREATYPWLVANVFDSLTGRRPEWARPSAIVSAGRYRIAVIGYVAAVTKTIVLAQHVRGLVFRGGRAAIADVLAETKAAQPDLTILVAHEGARCDTICHGEIIDLARQLEPGDIDLVVAGHTHTLINTAVAGIPIVSARANGTAVGVADLLLDGEGGRRWNTRVETVFVDRVRPDSAALVLVERYRPLVDPLANRVIVTLADSLVGGRGEFPLGNLIADAQRAVAKADVGLMNNGGIRRSLLPGPITYSDLFELHPFSNVIVRVTLTGRQLKEVLEHALVWGPPDAHLSGLTVRYDPTRPRGDRVRDIRDRKGARIVSGRRYLLAVSDFLAGGGGGYAMLRGLPQLTTDRTDLEAMIAWLERRPQPVRAPSDRRWIRVNAP